ncbi:TetR/AcrR family transcriptional regulator [Burkholderia cenocepacia]|uniref:TetR/AcrR family transcriptional regulator n=1 Tax=Burkholderia cenocepacia TaxID=95486 RepID=UPI001FC85E48|nr:helix-turn-helix domain-containing protein [Burkholderia cenocepacia]
MARTRNENLHQQRRAQILTAAARVFKAKGFHGARTEDICAAADMSAGAVFRYFADKREMIDAIISVEVERYTAGIRSHPQQGRAALAGQHHGRRTDRDAGAGR